MAKRVEGRSDRLLECAMAEFMEMGYQEASLRVIAAKAETTTGSIYTRFKYKEGLFHALVDTTIDELILWMREGNEWEVQPGGEKLQIANMDEIDFMTLLMESRIIPAS